MSAVAIFSVALGGAIGSIARYCVGVYASKLLGTAFPWGTLLINVTASFLLGVLTEAFALGWDAAPTTRTLLIVGVCGGYSTFSTFSLEVLTLVYRGALVSAGLYAVSSVVLSLAGLFVALRVMRSLVA